MAKTAKRKGSKFFRVVFQLVVILSAAGWMTFVIMEHGAPRPQERMNWTRRDGFIALSYLGISRGEDGPHLSRTEFLRHLEALSEAGFETVTMDDIIAFYRDGATLPDKALHLMFESGRKDSAIYGQEALVATGMRASMFVHASLLGRWNRSFLDSSQLAALGRSEFWEVGSHGYRLYLDSGWYEGIRRRYYLNDYFRDAVSGERIESDDDYFKRATDDYERADSAIARLTGERPKAYMFTPANTINNSLDRRLTRVNNAIMHERYDLAFTREGIAFNPRFADRWDLSRMRVPATATPETLLDEIKKWLSNSEPFTLDADTVERRWQNDYGALTVEPHLYIIDAQGDPNGFGWLRGSDNWRNLTSKIMMDSFEGGENSQCNIYLRFASRSAFVRVSLFPGKLVVDERRPKGGLSVLYSSPIQTRIGEVLECVVRNNRLWMKKNGLPVNREGIPLSPSVASGRIAIGLTRDKTGEAFAVFPDNEAIAREDDAPEPEIDESVHRASFSVMDLIPIPDRWRIVDETMLRQEFDPWGDLGFTGYVVSFPIAADAGRDFSRLLLQTSDGGVDGYAMLPEGSLDLSLPDTAVSTLPEVVRRKIWRGVIITPGRDAPWSDVADACRTVARGGMEAILRLDQKQAEEMLASGVDVPATTLILRGEWTLGTADTMALRKRRDRILVEPATGGVFE